MLYSGLGVSLQGERHSALVRAQQCGLSPEGKVLLPWCYSTNYLL